MSTPGPQVRDDMAVDVALSVMAGARLGHLVICDADGRCAGLVTRNQLAAVPSASWGSDDTRLRDIVHDRGPFTPLLMSHQDAEDTMRGRDLGVSPVIDEDGYALGVLVLSQP
ncbi:CBS domain-containing protein [Streptomyces sp. NPDC050704]|uniref:CBS domain-containing protein n=1 Tax=Streptomyces sp. NPDC050704 TaxID=3157219 RepID=UPI003436BA31